MQEASSYVVEAWSEAQMVGGVRKGVVVVVQKIGRVEQEIGGVVQHVGNSA